VARGDVPAHLAALAERGVLELATTAATHAFLPTTMTRAAVRAQLRMGRKYFARVFGKSPRAMWLPECGFDPKLDAELAGAGARSSVIEAHGALFARPRPPSGLFAPISSPAGVAYFPRHVDLCALVWSRERGYPGDPAYREFHVSLGDGSDPASTGGLKPFRVTGRAEKLPYAPDVADAKAREHAAHFVEAARRTLLDAGDLPMPAVATVAFDAELFGHFYWEGPRFLESVLRLADGAAGQPLASSLGGHLALDPELYVAMPATSTWGDGGFAEVWTHPRAAHVLRSAHRAEQRVLAVDAAVRDTPKGAVERRARLWAIRELFLLQASDHAFMMRAGSFAEYAEKMAKDHAERVERLTDIALRGGGRDAEAYVEATERAHPLFVELDEDAWADAFDEF
ncbi:MAG TPA: 1,4-alpha-glucan branching protein domain-containing protein, partial [Polyangiaceae bacterium]|nr:1,4-alpha-glucan branching protein domain-containing protein [Polyangiaceae bacterium]